MLKSRSAVLKSTALSELTGQVFEEVPFKAPKPVGKPQNLRGFGKAFGIVGTGASVASYPVNVYKYGWEEASKSAVESLLDPFGVSDEMNNGYGVRCVLWGEGCPAPAIA